MLRSQRLAVVLALEERKEKAALEKMAEAQQHHEAQRQQIENLEQYQQEYREQIRRSQQGVAPLPGFRVGRRLSPNWIRLSCSNRNC